MKDAFTLSRLLYNCDDDGPYVHMWMHVNLRAFWDSFALELVDGYLHLFVFSFGDDLKWKNH